MSSQSEQRVRDAISGLISYLIPQFEGEDDAIYEDRQGNAFELVASILNRLVANIYLYTWKRY
jgi:hypothetical protein